MSGQKFESVWDAICDSPEQAQHMKVRSKLLMQLSEYVKNELMEKQQLSGQETGKILGLTQPQVSYLVRGKIDRFSLDRLVEIASRAGFHVTMEMEREASAA